MESNHKLGWIIALVSNIIANDFYVDDLLTGHCHLSSAGFILRKLISNHAQVLTHLNTDGDDLTILNLSEGESFKTLGIKWFSETDQLNYFISESHSPEPLSTQLLWSLQISWDDSVPTEYIQEWKYFRNQLINLN